LIKKSDFSSPANDVRTARDTSEKSISPAVGVRRFAVSHPFFWPRLGVGIFGKKGATLLFLLSCTIFAPIKSFRNIIRWCVAVVLLLYVAFLVAVNMPPVRRMMAREASALLAHKIGSHVSIGDLEIGALNRIVLHDVLLEDRAGKPLIDGKLLSAKIAWLPLLDGEVRLRSISLLDTRVRLSKERADTAANFRFLLDAFSAKERKEPSRLNLQINSLILRRCHVSYDARYVPETPGRFNLSHLNVKDLDAGISLKRLTADSLDLRLRSLKLREQSGLDVQGFTLRLSADKHRCRINRFDLSLPGSRMVLPEISLRYDLTAPAGLLSTLRLDGTMRNVRVNTQDVACFFPRLRQVRRTFLLGADFSVSPRQIRLRKVNLSESKGDFALLADGVLTRNKTGIGGVQADVRKIDVRSEIFSELFLKILQKPFPEMLERAGDLAFSGKVAWQRGRELHVAGEARTAVGQLAADVTGRGSTVSGTVDVRTFELATLLADKSLPERMTFTLQGHADFTRSGRPDVEGDLQLRHLLFNGHLFEDIRVRGSWVANLLDARVQSNDSDLKLTATLNGHFDGKDFSQLQLNADVERLSPAVLGLAGKFARPVYSGRLLANLSDLNPRKLPMGQLQLSSFLMNGTPSLALEHLQVRTAPSARGTRVDVESDFADLQVDGPLIIEALRGSIDNILARCLPSFTTRKAGGMGHEWAVRGELRDASFLKEVFGVPLQLDGPLQVEGNLRDDDGRMALVATTAGFSYDGFSLTDVSVYVSGEGTRLEGIVRGEKEMRDGPMTLEAAAHVQDGALNTSVRWQGGITPALSGELNASSLFTNSEFGRTFTTRLLPSEIAIGDTVWNVLHGQVDYSDRALTLTDIALGHADQSLTVDGRLSPNPEDSILATLHKVDIEYVLGLVDFHAVDFAGQATGQISVSKHTGAPMVSADIQVPDFKFNDGPMGHLHLTGGFDSREKRIDLDGHMENPDSGYTDVKGFVSLQYKGLDLNVTGRHTNLKFLQRYISGIFGDFQGRATGRVHLYGPFKELDFEGEELAEAEATVLATGVHYKVREGKVVIAPGEFSFRNFTLQDKQQGRGAADGRLLHSHLKNLRFDFGVEADKLLVYDQPRSADMPFYATAYGTGNLQLHGKPGAFEADIDMRPEKGTMFVYTLNTPETFGEEGLVKFRDKTPAASDEIVTIPVPASGEEEVAQSDIRLNMLLDVHPEATVKVIMDEKSGDHILVHGSGPIRANFYNKGDFRMYGTYTIDDGVYKMSLQDVIRKDFILTKGGHIVFGGDPYQGDLDMQAVYTVNSASLSDLNIGGNFSQNSVRVNCLLNFSGKVRNPRVAFDIDLPTVNSEEKQMVRNIISTEEDMNMQVLYLLGIGRFYTYNNSQAGTEVGAGAQSSAAMKSFLSSTFSSQLNHIIQNAVGSSNWSFGANVSTGSAGTNDMEVEGLLSGRLFNNRLLVNGNIGYRDNSYYSSNFIGDFDVRYLLTPGGSVSLKAYSETNDRYFTKSALTTQGAGIMLQRDFSNLKELFHAKKKKKKSKLSKK